MEVVVNLFTCIFEIIIFDMFFKSVMQKRYPKLVGNIILYSIIVMIICWVNVFENTKINLLTSIIVYAILCIVLFVGDMKQKFFYFVCFYTVFAGVEIIFEFLLSSICGNTYTWASQDKVFRLIIGCLEKLITFIILYFIGQKLSKESKGMKNKLLLCFFVLPITTFWIYSTLLYSNLRQKISEINDIVLIMGCIMLFFSNVVIFLLYDYIFLLNQKKQTLEVDSLKSKMEKKYYDKLEKVSKEQTYYMHDLKHYLKTIGTLAVQEQNSEIQSVIKSMQIKIEEIEEEFFCKHKILNTILCEKKNEAKSIGIIFKAYIEPHINLDFIQDIDIITIMGNLIENAIESAKKTQKGFIDINIFDTQKGHFLIIKVENSFSGAIQKRGADLMTTKENVSKHGMGVNNIRKSIEKYGAFLQMDFEEHIFVSTIVFSVI